MEIQIKILDTDCLTFIHALQAAREMIDVPDLKNQGLVSRLEELGSEIQNSFLEQVPSSRLKELTPDHGNDNESDLVEY